MSIKDGGPAFPRAAGVWTEDHGDGAWAQDGMTLLDYFAARAPLEPQSWFEPVMSGPRPEAKYDHDHPNAPRCCGEFECAPTNAAERSAWLDDYRRQYVVQWPYAWASAMLTERARAKP